jgi:hypothetical protein
MDEPSSGCQDVALLQNLSTSEFLECMLGIEPLPYDFLEKIQSPPAAVPPLPPQEPHASRQANPVPIVHTERTSHESPVKRKRSADVNQKDKGKERQQHLRTRKAFDRFFQEFETRCSQAHILLSASKAIVKCMGGNAPAPPECLFIERVAGHLVQGIAGDQHSWKNDADGGSPLDVRVVANITLSIAKRLSHDPEDGQFLQAVPTIEQIEGFLSCWMTVA